MPISEHVRSQIVALNEHSNLKQKDIAKLCKVSQSAVSKILKRFRSTGSLETAYVGNTGRKRMSTDRDDRLLLVKSKKNPRLTSRELCRELKLHGVSMSSRTVRRRLQEFNRPARRPVKRQLLTRRMRKSRLAWAKTHQHWTVEDWKKVKFSLLIPSKKKCKIL